MRNIVLLLALVVVIGFLTGSTVGGVIEALTSPTLPKPIEAVTQKWRGDQAALEADANRFHFESQGTRTLPIPLSWFLALEEPVSHPLAVPFVKRERFAGNQYLTRFGFIPAQANAANPHGLPIGFATQVFQTIEGLSRKETSIGLTCAACHTGQLIYQGKRYVIEGGPATTDLGQLTLALGAALGQTALSGKLPILNGRFERFAKAVLGEQFSDKTSNQLAEELDGVLKKLLVQPNAVDVVEGFTRLDALNRIGNQVFALDTHRYDNYVNINAPVKFPHIWTSSWFNWVQYDGSIMNPLIRNAGEAMGVRAEIDFTAPPGKGRFASSIPLKNLYWIEKYLRGNTPPLEAKAFTGLNGPSWPADFPPIDAAKAAEGAKLYEQHCSGCHLPALTQDVARGKQPDSPFWSHFAPIEWTRKGETLRTAESVLFVNIISGHKIGTDPAQGAVLSNRRVNTSGSELGRAGDFSPGLGIDMDVCAPGPNGLTTKHIDDNSKQLFANALGAAVQMVVNEWFRFDGTSPAERMQYESDRPNCLQAGAGYKARPLNGIWAVAPFLHNGSVPTLYDLLSPARERPKAFLLGNPTFDPVRVGLKTIPVEPDGRIYDRNGYFILDTSKPGNRNTGHEFSNDNGDGIIGKLLSPNERNAIIEFLKTM